MGQHLVNLDLLLLEECVSTVSSLFDDLQVSMIKDVRKVVDKKSGALLEDIFSNFLSESISELV